MKKLLLITVLLLSISTVQSQVRMRIAIFDFKAGAGVENSMVNSLSDMLINSMFSTNHYTIVERTQIDKIIREQGFQKGEITEDVSVKIGQILNVKAIVLGTVIQLGGEYNLDIRLVDVENGELISTAGVTKRPEDTFRDMMNDLTLQLDNKLYGLDKRKKYAKDNGTFDVYPAQNVYLRIDDCYEYVEYLNSNKYGGYDDWRLCSEAEMMQILKSYVLTKKAGIKYGKWYHTSSFSGNNMHKIVKLKRNGKVVSRTVGLSSAHGLGLIVRGEIVEASK